MSYPQPLRPPAQLLQNWQSIIVLTSLPRRTLAVERAHPVDAGSAVEAGGARAVVDVHRALRTRPPVHTDAREAAH